MSFRKLFFLILILFFTTTYYFYFNIYKREMMQVDEITFTIEKNESVSKLADRLEEEKIIKDAWLFKKYLIWKKQDRNITYGEYTVKSPITLARLVEVLNKPDFSEMTLTVLPGSTMRTVSQSFAQQTNFEYRDFENILGISAFDYRKDKKNLVKIANFGKYKVLKDKPNYVSLDGYLAPETFNFYKKASAEEIIEKFIAHRDSQFTDQMYDDIEKSGRTVYEILIMASILEKEVRGLEDKKKVADLFWRRYDQNWALQADSTVHYVVNKAGNVFTTAEDRKIDSPWNTYKYPGLPLGPICNPSLDSIMAAIYPTKNNYNYFLTDLKGVVYYAVSNDEHNQNRFKYL
jgi:UPF0755 protein